MKSTIYQHHLRASASFSYRHLLHWKRGDPSPGRWPSPLGFAALTGLPGPFPGPSLPCPTGAAVVDSFGTSRPRPAGAALTLTLEGQRGRRDVDTWGAAADFGLVEPSRRPPRRP